MYLWTLVRLRLNWNASWWISRHCMGFRGLGTQWSPGFTISHMANVGNIIYRTGKIQLCFLIYTHYLLQCLQGKSDENQCQPSPLLFSLLAFWYTIWGIKPNKVNDTWLLNQTTKIKSNKVNDTWIPNSTWSWPHMYEGNCMYMCII